MKKTAADVAYEAAEYLAEHGHCKKTLRDSQGRVCLVGAIDCSQDSSWFFYDNSNEEIRRLRDTLSRVTGTLMLTSSRGIDNWEELIHWNNAPERTGEEVILALKQAGHLLANGE